MPDWPTPRGPYSGNAAFEVPLGPPLAPAWTVSVAPAPHDPPVVAGAGRVIVPTAGTDAVALDAAGGSAAWRATRCRRREYECYLAGARVLAFRGQGTGGPYDYETSFLDARSGEEVALKVPCVPLGLHARAGHEWLWLRDADVRLDDLQVRPRVLPLFGKVHGGQLFGRRAEGSQALLGRWDPERDEPRWEVPTDLPENVVSVGARALVAHRRDGRFSVRAAEDGRLLWTIETGQTWETHTRWLVLDAAALHVDEDGRLAAYDLASGGTAWQTTARRWSNLVGTGGLVWAARETKGSRFELVALEAATGAEVWAAAVPASGPRCLLALAGGALLCDLKRTLVCWRGPAAV